MDLLTVGCVATVVVAAAGVTVYVNRKRQKAIAAMEKERDLRKEPLFTEERRSSPERSKSVREAATVGAAKGFKESFKTGQPGLKTNPIPPSRPQRFDADRHRERMEENDRLAQQREFDRNLLATAVLTTPSSSSAQEDPVQERRQSVHHSSFSSSDSDSGSFSSGRDYGHSHSHGCSSSSYSGSDSSSSSSSSDSGSSSCD